MTKQIAKITLPLYIEGTAVYPKGTPATAAHSFLEFALLKTFGGYTRYEARGAWQDDDGVVYYDENYVYDVAIEPIPSAIQKFRDIAVNAGQLAGQEAIAIVLPAGIFEVIKL
jgi:hypothetical protein